MNRIDQNHNQIQKINKKPQTIQILSTPKNKSVLLIDPIEQKNRYPNQKISQFSDYYNAIQLASFIGLQHKAYLRNIQKTKQQRFLHIHDFLDQSNLQKSKQFIKNDILNRDINFFDLKKIWENRCSKLKYQTSKTHYQKDHQRTKRNIQKKQKRILSAQNGKRFTHSKHQSSLEKFSQTIQSDPNLMRLKLKTARQINRRKKQKVKEQLQKEKIVHSYYTQKFIRSQILGDISKNQTPQILSQSRQIGYQRWKSTNQHSVKRKGYSSPSKIQNYMKQSQLTKANSKINPSGYESASHIQNPQISSMYPETPKQFSYSAMKVKRDHKRSQSCTYGSIINSYQRKIFTSKNDYRRTSLNLTRQEKILSKLGKHNQEKQPSTSKYPQTKHANQQPKKSQLQKKLIKNSLTNQVQKRIYLKTTNKIRLRLNKNTNTFQFAQK